MPKSQTNDPETRHDILGVIKDETNHGTNKEEDDLYETVKDEVDSDDGQDFVQYSDWEDANNDLIDQQSPKETKKATPGRKRGRPLKIQQDENADTDNDDSAQYSDWEDASALLDQSSPKETKALDPRKATTGRKRGRPRKQENDEGEDTDSDNDDPSWKADKKKKAPASKRGRPRKIQQASEDDTSDADNDDPNDVKVKKGKGNSELVENGGKKKRASGSKKVKGRLCAPSILCPHCGQEFRRSPKKGGYPG